MADPLAGRNASARPAVNGPAAGPETSDDESFAQLRSLLVGPEQRELMTLHEHLFDPAVQVRDVSRVLPDAIALVDTDPCHTAGDLGAHLDLVMCDHVPGSYEDRRRTCR